MVICKNAVRTLAERMHKRLRLKGTTTLQIERALREALMREGPWLTRYEMMSGEHCGAVCNRRICPEVVPFNPDGD